MSTKAFLLAFQDGEEFTTCEYGYVAPDAAKKASPVINGARVARGKVPYSHLVEFAGNELQAIRLLEAA